MSIGNNIGVPIKVVNRNTNVFVRDNAAMSIGQRVREARKDKNLTQVALASKAGIAQGTLSELENGESASTAYVATLAAILDVNPLWLETGRGPKKGPPAVDASAANKELERVHLLISLYMQSNASNREFIIASARIAADRSRSAADAGLTSGN